LRELIEAQMARVPFENISKLYYRKRIGLCGVVNFERFLEGMERDNFGGTCYTTNYYFNLLLKFLGYDIRLCGADMSHPDVHLVSMARLDGCEFMVDIGYAAPFTMPLPRDLGEDFIIEHGEDRYILRPQDAVGRSRMDMYRDGQYRHGYVAKPEAREIGQFAGVIAQSFSEEATFMNAVLLTRHWPGGSISIRNLSVVEVEGAGTRITPLSGREELIGAIEEHFGIAPAISAEAIGEIRAFKDAWD
jgi:arylamine N-acetyltransferase